jgi:predicted nucleic acid-binding protein
VIVADTNLISYLLIEGEQTDLARAVWVQDSKWAMPPLWRSEFLNVLVVAHRAGVLDAKHASLLWRRSSVFLNATELEPDGEKVLEIAIEKGISAYDAQFVAVAAELGVPLITADKRLLSKCRSQAVSLQEFANN